MFDKPTANQTLGLELDSFALHVAAVSLNRNGVVIDALMDLPLESRFILETDVKPLYTEEEQKELHSLAASHLIVTSLPTVDIIIRPLELALKKEKEIDAVLNFQAEPLLPYPIENGIIDRIILAKNKEGSRLAVLAARKDHIEAHLNQWKSLEIEPEVITADPVALTAFGLYFSPATPTYFGIYLGYTHSFCTLVIDGKLIASQAVAHGLNDLIIAIDGAANLGVQAAYASLMASASQESTKEMLEIIQPHLDVWNMAVMRTVLSLAKQAKGFEINHILLTGPGSVFTALTNAIATSLNKAPIACEATLGNYTEQQLCSFALPIGAALSALPTFSDQINFRKPPLAFPNPWKRMKIPLATYIGLCLALTCALFLFGKAYIHHQQIAVKQDYLNLLSILHKTHDEFEKEHHLKGGSSENGVDSLTDDEIEERLNIIEKEIAAIPQLFPLQPNVPLVSDVLAWLSTYPSFQPLQEGGSDQNTMKIESLSYMMVKRPDPTKKQEKYQVKAELELSSPTPKMAREFHDSLIEPNDFVDAKSEIKWSASRDRYRTSFFLKDKTLYSTE